MLAGDPVLPRPVPANSMPANPFSASPFFVEPPPVAQPTIRPASVAPVPFTMPPMRAVEGTSPKFPIDWEGRLAAVNRGPLAWGLPAFLIGFGAFYLASLVIAGAVNGASTGVDALPATDRGPLLMLALLPNVLLGVVPAMASWKRGRGLRLDFGIVPTRRDLGIGLACGGSALVIGLVVNFLLTKFVFRGAGSSNVVQQLDQLSGGRSVWLLITAAYLVLGAPLMEELAVRGALWGALEHYRVNRYAVLALTALVFAFMHQEPTLTLALFCQGLAIGVARLATGRISTSMIAHATNNLIPALILVFAG